MKSVQRLLHKSMTAFTDLGLQLRPDSVGTGVLVSFSFFF